MAVAGVCATGGRPAGTRETEPHWIREIVLELGPRRPTASSRARTVAWATSPHAQGRVGEEAPSADPRRGGFSRMASPIDPSPGVFVGIDVAKDELVLAERPSGRTWSVPNEPAALAALAAELQQQAPTRVVLEATGGYERAAVAALQMVGLPIVVANPRQVRQFARSLGRLAKTDRLDAAVLAHYAEAVQPPVRPTIDAATQELDAWVARRRQLVQQITAERLRLASAHPSVRPGVTRHIEWLEEELAAVEQAIAEQLAQSSVMTSKAELLQTVPGIGPVTAAVLVAQVPELGQIDAKALAALIGVAPLNRDSGKHRGKRCTWGGRAA